MIAFALGMLAAYLIAGVVWAVGAHLSAEDVSKQVSHYRWRMLAIVPLWPWFAVYVFRSLRDARRDAMLGFHPDGKDHHG